MTGDITYSRTCRSLLQAPSKFDVQVTMAFPYPSMAQDIIHLFPKAKCIPESQIAQHLPEIDVLYMTRHQTERGQTNGTHFPSSFVLTPELCFRMQPWQYLASLPQESRTAGVGGLGRQGVLLQANGEWSLYQDGYPDGLPG